MFRLLFIQFIRSKTAIIALALIFTTGIISLFIGKQFLVKQEKTIAAVTKFQQEHIERNTHFHNDDFGLLMYYLRFGLINKPEQLAGLSIGQSDVNSSVQSVTIRALEAQKYDTDLNNPYNLLSGNLDLSFVIIYLFPMLIIAFTFNLLSEEKEGDTWQLVTAQSTSPIKYLLAKLAVRAIAVVIVFALLLLLSIPILSIQWNKTFALFAATCVGYLIFWIALCFLFVTFKKSSGFNAVALLSSWVLLTVLLPAGVNNIITNKYPVPEALQTIIKSRDGYHKKWDVDKTVTMTKFFELYPQFKNYPVPDKTFSWLWYYAMWHMGDHDATKDAQEMRSKLLQRENTSRTVAAFLPTMHAQLQLNDIAKTGMLNHISFLDSTTAFHEKMRLFFYPKIFENANVNSVDWHRIKPEYYSDPYEMNGDKTLFPLVIAISFLLLLSCINSKNMHEV